MADLTRQLDVFRTSILKGNNEWCSTERLEIQEKVEAELSDAAIHAGEMSMAILTRTTLWR